MTVGGDHLPAPRGSAPLYDRRAEPAAPGATGSTGTSIPPPPSRPLHLVAAGVLLAVTALPAPAAFRLLRHRTGTAGRPPERPRPAQPSPRPRPCPLLPEPSALSRTSPDPPRAPSPELSGILLRPYRTALP
ncbi:hypothetical protein ACFYOV_19585 [Streptomyces sp. NPDC005931]|uniref:hypothetical protein n=1 Tax=Streptomyces sp. NPDC005931 TaxID=3364737 RepID=UPI0036C51FB5